MGYRGHSASKGRPYSPDPFGRDAQNRVRIAQAAARLIVEHGLTDWSLAKRKAARQLMLSEREALPDDGEIEVALAEHHALFGGGEHAAALRAQREEALVWLRRLDEFRPVLVGGVAAGWASVVACSVTVPPPAGSITVPVQPKKSTIRCIRCCVVSPAPCAGCSGRSSRANIFVASLATSFVSRLCGFVVQSCCQLSAVPVNSQ